MQAARRRFLLGAAALGGLASTAWGRKYFKEGISNPCLASLPPALADHELIRSAWAGLNAEQVWDVHAHIAGTGDSGSGIVVNPALDSLFHPGQYAQKLFYMNAGCAHRTPGQVDSSYVDRMRNLVDGMAPGFRLMLLAFDWFHDAQGKPDRSRSTFYVPNSYAQSLAQTYPESFRWTASIHPYRPDAVDALDQAVRGGAKAVKWLPAAQGMDPASSLCDPFYAALSRHQLPLLVHAGEEKAVHGGDTQHYGNPLRLRRALDHGVKIIVAHCASLGMDTDLDRGALGPKVSSFGLFARLMDESRSQGTLCGDISAITQINRGGDVLRTLLQRQDWHDRLLHGSDYPLPGVMPLYSTDYMIELGLLPASYRGVLTTLRQHNPLLFDLVLKRHLRFEGYGFSTTVFENRRHFPAKGKA